MTRINIARTLARSAVNGPGERFVVWVQGCPLACPGCWNPDTWAFTRRDLREVSTLAEEVLAGGLDLTLTGGEPFAQARACADLAERVRAEGRSVFVFTGYDADELTTPDQRRLWEAADIIVTGRYIAALRAPDLLWRGSSNQIIHNRTGIALPTCAPSVEFHVGPTGDIVITGFPIVFG